MAKQIYYNREESEELEQTFKLLKDDPEALKAFYESLDKERYRQRRNDPRVQKSYNDEMDDNLAVLMAIANSKKNMSTFFKERPHVSLDNLKSIATLWAAKAAQELRKSKENFIYFGSKNTAGKKFGIASRIQSALARNDFEAAYTEYNTNKEYLFQNVETKEEKGILGKLAKFFNTIATFISKHTRILMSDGLIMSEAIKDYRKYKGVNEAPKVKGMSLTQSNDDDF